MLELVVSRSGKELVALPLDRETLRVGRAGTNDLSLPDPMVSRHQCEIVYLDEELVRVEDKSGNGTSVNGKLVREAEVEPGARIEFGSLTVTSAA
jgi:pSer/pThr/pTyr-binding forkhead associated (FHA) protein